MVTRAEDRTQILLVSKPVWARERSGGTSVVAEGVEVE